MAILGYVEYRIDPMIMIRDRQMEVLQSASLQNFENTMVRHIEKFTPPHYRILGEAGVRDVIRLGIERAQQYELTYRGPTRFYIEMMFMFGSFFDTDPQLPWAQHILTDDQIGDQMERSEQLYAKTTDYLEKAAGPESAYSKRALRAIRKRVDDPVSFSTEFFENEMLLEMQRIYPEKYIYVGEMALRDLIREGSQTAKSYSVEKERGVALFVVLMFAIGHGFAEDPLFPWISGTLQNPKIDHPDKRVQRLESKSITYLDHVLAYFNQE